MITDPSRRIILIFGGVIVVALAVGLGIFIGQRNVASPPSTPAKSGAESRKSPVPSDTAVKLVLVDELTSGGSETGSSVRFALTSSIPDSDLPPVGTIITGKVSWSRAEGSLGALTDTPARLNVALDPMGNYSLSGQPKAVRDIEFNRANTGLPESSSAPMATEERATLLEHLLTTPGGVSIPTDAIESLKSDTSLPATEKFLSQSRSSGSASLIAALASGGTSAEFELALSAVNEVRSVLGRNLGALKRRLGGRNIHAYPGTEVTVYLTPIRPKTN